jgi:hypothetical protein
LAGGRWRRLPRTVAAAVDASPLEEEAAAREGRWDDEEEEEVAVRRTAGSCGAVGAVAEAGKEYEGLVAPAAAAPPAADDDDGGWWRTTVGGGALPLQSRDVSWSCASLYQ